MRRSDGSLIGVGGLRLAYRSWEVRDARAAIVVVHGLGEHSGRYAELGERMAGYGFSTFAVDLRGHGLSDGRRGHVPSFDVYLQELDRFRREVEGLADFQVPLFLLGHSMGGLIVSRYLEEYNTRFTGGIIISPWLATAMEVPRWKSMAANALNRIAPSLPFSSGLDPARLSRDPDVVEAYRSDPLVHDRITPRLFHEISAAMGLTFQRSDRIQEPLLLLVGGDDRIVDPDRTLLFSKQITVPDLTVKVYPGFYHELLNEVDRYTIHRQLRDWIAARV